MTNRGRCGNGRGTRCGRSGGHRNHGRGLLPNRAVPKVLPVSPVRFSSLPLSKFMQTALDMC